MSTNPSDDNLTPAQRDYFDILEELHPSPSLQRSIARAKEDLAFQARRKEAEDLAREKPHRQLLRRFRSWLGQH
jgi:hypothetical protein